MDDHDTLDFTVSDEGSLSILTPLTGIAKEWLEERMPDDVQMWGGGYVVEPRYVGAIVSDLVANDFTVGMA